MDKNSTTDDIQVKKKKRSQWCSAVGCKNGRYNRPNLSFFRFPKDIERCKQWVLNCRRDDLIQKSSKVLFQSNVLCGLHFDKSQFTTRGKRLNSLAVPTLFNTSNSSAFLEVSDASRSNHKVYCCARHCSSNSQTVEPRTGKRVRMHGFPNPNKEKERCQQWLINIKRDDLSLLNLKFKRLCSMHFTIKSYSCPSDISSSHLLPTAVPAIFTYYCHGPTLSKRKVLSKPDEIVIKKIKTEVEPCTSDCGKSRVQSSEMMDKLKKIEEENKILKENLDNVSGKLTESLKEIKELKKENYIINKKFQRLKSKNINIELSARKCITQQNEIFLNSILSQLPEVPSHLSSQLPKIPSNLLPLMLLKNEANGDQSN